MNMSEDEHNKEDVINHHALEDDCSTQLFVTPRPSLSTDQMRTYKHRTQDRWAIDEIFAMIMPVISALRIPIRRALTTSQKATVAGTADSFTPVYNLIKSSGIYALASVASPLVGLVLAPFLTHRLSPTDYGILTILNTLISLGAGITGLGLGYAFFRAYNYDYTSDRDQRDVLATVSTLLCLVSIPVVVGMAITAPSLAGLLFGRASLGGLVVLASGVIFLQNLTIPGFAWLRAESRSLFYSLLAISNVVIVLIANIVLVGMLHLGVAGSIIGTGCGYASVLVCIMPIILLRAGIRIRADIAQSLLAFGLPLVLNFVSYWVLQLSDRYLLSIFTSLTETARYAVAYTLGSAMSVVVMGPFTLAWPPAMFAIAKREDAAQVFRLVFRWFSMLLLFVAFGLSLVGTIFLDWLFPVSYHSVALIIPIVAESIAFYGVYYVFMAGANVTRRTWLAAVFTTTAAIVNVVLNLFLIPHYGAIGAAVSTLLAYVALAGVAYVVNQRIYPVPFDIGIFIIALLLGTAFYIGSGVLGRNFGTYGAWGIAFCTLIVYGGCLALLGKLPTKSH